MIAGSAVSTTAAVSVPEPRVPLTRSESVPISGGGVTTPSEQAPFDPGAVIEEVQHHVEARAGSAKELVARDPLYRAVFDSTGFKLSSSNGLGLDDAQFRISTPTAGDQVEWAAAANTASRTIAPGVTERVTARDGEVEWDFVLKNEPAGAFDVTAPVVGAAQVRRDNRARAIRWGLPNGLSVRMSEMVVVDASGRELYRALPEATRRSVRLDVPKSVLADAHYPVVVDPVISAPTGASDPVYAPAQGTQITPDVAWNGTTYFVVWMDGRGSGQDVYGARVTADGRVLDHDGIPIAPHPGYSDVNPVVSWNGSNFLVVWRKGFVVAARVAPDGSVLDPSPIQISSRYPTSLPDVASDGNDWFVVWGDDRYESQSGPDGDIFGARVSADGDVIDENGAPISVASGYQHNPTLTWGGAQYLVGWTDSGSDSCNCDTGRVARVTSSGEVLDPSGIHVSDAPLESIAWDGTRFLVVWRTAAYGVGAIKGARVGPDGTVVDPAGLVIADALGESPDVVWNGTTYLVVWSDLRAYNSGGPDIYGARLTAEGVAPDREGGFLIAASPEYQGMNLQPRVATDGTNFLVTWHSDRNDLSGSDIYAARVSSTATVLDPNGILVSYSANDQARPAIAFDGSNYLVVWEDYRSRVQPDVYGARVSPEGHVLDGSGFVISNEPVDEGNLAVHWGGESFLVVWSQRRSETNYEFDVYGARVTSDGVVLDPGGIPISTATYDQRFPDVAWNGTHFLVAWMDVRRAQGWDIYAARVSPSGEVLDPDGLAVATSSETQELPAISSDGRDFLIVFHGFTHPYEASATVRSVRVTTEGHVAPEKVVGDAYSSYGQDGPPTAPSIVWNGTTYFVAWTEITPERSVDIHAARVDPDGTAIDTEPIGVSENGGGQRQPVVGWNGVNHIVVWVDSRFRDPNAGCNLCAQADTDLYGARVSPSGEVLDPSGIRIATSTTDEDRPSLVQGPGGAVALAYQRFSLERPWAGTERIFMRFITEDPPEGSGGDSGSGGGGSGGGGSEPTPSPTESGSPTPEPSPSVSESPTPTPSPTPTSTPPEHVRETSLSLRRHLVATGFVRAEDGYSACQEEVPVTVQRRKRGRWSRVGGTTTDETGRYRLRVRDRGGRYRAVAPRYVVDGEVCAGSSSPIARHRH